MSSNYKAALPNGFFQAVSAHLPVLVGDELPEVVEIVNKYRMGSPIDLGDPASIAHTLNMFARSPDLRSRYKAGASQASVDLNWRNEEALLVERITKALEAG
ncbi:hypothetical protein GCM10011587_02840 [Pyruvatibacter mobilis]|nr:hypothetical protein GCM10011587_02840 [Pyruvatibacter mobilis]